MLTTYDGGKNQAGTWQRIISLMPPHERYVEAFLGSGAILRRKRPAAVNVGIDKDPRVIEHFDASDFGDSSRTGNLFAFICDDAIRWLAFNDLDASTLIYADPPYLLSTRSNKRPLYRAEFSTEAAHDRLLSLLSMTPARVMISGYPSPFYDGRLSSWQRRSWLVTKRNGARATEVLWFNFDPPDELHDYRFIGRDFHDRSRIWRKLHRWQRKLNALPAVERNALLSGILTPDSALRTGRCSTSSTP